MKIYLLLLIGAVFVVGLHCGESGGGEEPTDSGHADVSGADSSSDSDTSYDSAHPTDGGLPDDTGQDILEDTPAVDTSVDDSGVSSQSVSDHQVATETALRAIPESAITQAKENLRIAYFHSSHGSRVITGMEGLVSYKTGDDSRYALVTTGAQTAGKLTIDDHYEGGNDLSAKEEIQGNGHTQWYNETVAFIQNPANSAINVIMWSWCDPAGHDHQKYIDDMEDLIAQYGPSGSLIGTGAGKRATPIVFVFMSGHPNGDGESSDTLSAYHAHTLIKAHCLSHNRFMLDYWDIETYAMDGTYYPWADDDGVSQGLKFYQNWQNAHPGEWFENECEHATQNITCNRIAYAAWWLWARIAGWNGN